MIRVLVAEDSMTVRELLVHLLEEDPEIQVVGQARNGVEAVEMAIRLRPDLITMDIEMPLLNGFEATKEIMIQHPTPIVIVSSGGAGQVEQSLNATRAGALTIVPTPNDPQAEDFAAQRDNLLRTVKTMARVKVIRHWRGGGRPRPARRPAGTAAARVVAIAASTGGPAAVQQILAQLPRTFPLPILLVQHIARGFVQGLSAWLSGNCNLRVKLAEDGEPLLPRTVYLAPDDLHLGVGFGDRVVLSAAEAVGGFRPSADVLFRTAAQVYGAGAVGVILTGMGRDGVEGLRAVHAAGGQVLAQDAASSIVYGMPGEAVRAGVVAAELPLRRIAPRLAELSQGSR
jgi:two-component system chemotaxis response regulator CheB